MKPPDVTVNILSALCVHKMSNYVVVITHTIGFLYVAPQLYIADTQPFSFVMRKGALIA
jgi:hypothetical protein